MQKNRVPTQKTIVIAVVSMLLLIAVFLTAYHFLRQQGSEGAKTISVSVIVDGRTVRELDIGTDAAYLRQALDEKDLISGEESAYGLLVKTVDGVTADDANQEWWSFTKEGEFLMTGVDDTPIEDGDVFEITLTVGW
ncbi:MAG: DUF4430 domain-containing protein [Oscillospiraceae bacterium]|nr:DUF4430 domain-containing protein [Oscillospiraceae bacterium]